MKDYNYTHKQYKKDDHDLLQRYNNDEINFETYKTERRKFFKKLPTKEIIKDSVGLNAAARLSAMDIISREKNIDEKKLEKFYNNKLNGDCDLVNFNLGGGKY